MPNHSERDAAVLPVIAEFKVRRRGYLAPNGEIASELPGFARDPQEVIALYRGMVLLRSLDAKAVALQRTGSPRASLTPNPPGPRNWGQFSPRTG